MSGYKSHGSKHGRDRDRDRDRDGDGDSRDRHHQHHHSSRDRGESRGRDGSRDGRDRDYRSRDGRAGGPSSQGTPTKPPGGPPAAAGAAAAAAGKPAAARGGLLGSSFLSSSVLEAAKAEAAKRKAAEEAAAAAAAGRDSDEAEPGEVGGPQRKRPKHEPIVWHSPPRQAGDRPPSQQESLQERLQREAAEFRQQQHPQEPPGGSRPSSRQQRPGSRAGRSPSSSPDGGGGNSRGRPPSRSPEGGRRQQRGQRRSSSSDRSRSRSSSGSRERRPGGAPAAAKGRWQQQEEEEEEQRQQQKAGRSRWAAEEEDEEEGDAKGKAAAAAAAGVDELEEGEAVGAAIDEELEELNRRERADLAAGSDGEASGGEGGGAVLSDEAEQLRHEGLDLEVNMLEESHKVEDYEKLNRISEGTYGIVFRARHKASGRIYALKKLKMEQCPDGFPQTSVREVNVLLSLHHPNIVNVAEVCVGGRDGIFMVMEYVEHDLKYVMELQKAKKAQQFSIGQIKCLMQQLLEGVAFLHHRWVLHRDLKTSNLLYSNNGTLKICDFGLARQYGDPLSPYTPMVVTLWYRSIERLLGDPSYETALDMWSVGCIMAELLLGEPLFQGKGELDQIKKIFALLGTPTQESWPGWDSFEETKNFQWKPQESQLRSKFPTVFFGGSAPVLSDAGFDLLSRLLEMNPKKRISAEAALQHKWFQEAPRPVNPALMPSFTPRHQQSAAADGYRDKLHRPSPGAVGPAGFKI